MGRGTQACWKLGQEIWGEEWLDRVAQVVVVGLCLGRTYLILPNLCMAVWGCLPVDVETTGSGMDLTGGHALLQRDDVASKGTAQFPALVLGAAWASTSVVVGVWLVSRQSRTLLMWVSYVVVSLSCCKSSSIQCLSLADCSSCWPSLVDNTAREHSVPAPVVMVVTVVMRDAVFCWVALS